MLEETAWANSPLSSPSIALLLLRGATIYLAYPGAPRALDPLCVEINMINVRTCMCAELHRARKIIWFVVRFVEVPPDW